MDFYGNAALMPQTEPKGKNSRQDMLIYILKNSTYAPPKYI